MTSEVNTALLNAFEEDATEALLEWESSCLRGQDRAAVFESLMRCAHNLKGNSALIGFDRLAALIHRIEDALIKLNNNLLVKISDPHLVERLLACEKFLRLSIERTLADHQYAPIRLEAVAALENFQPNAAGEPSAATKGASVADALTSHPNESIRILSSKLDSLIQSVGELTLAQAIVNKGRLENRLHSPEVLEAIGLSDKITRTLRSTVLDMRMLPLVSHYQRLERAAIDLSLRLNKPLRFLAEGQDVSLDKAVLSRIFEPLLHVVRNAIDHGVESTDERRIQGKSDVATIKISAEIGPSGVTLCISDDGRGLDPKKIASRATNRGLIDKSDHLTEQEILSLIFRAGFSTAEKITEVSGRGIGLDVVEREVSLLGGHIQINSKIGEGTTFILTLPTNVSLVDVFVLDCAGVLYGVPAHDIAEVLDVADVKIESSPIYGQVAIVRDKTIPVETLSNYLNVARPVGLSRGHAGHLLIIQTASGPLGFSTNAVLDLQQVFVRPLKGYLSHLPWLTGSTITSNGEPSMIINLKAIGLERVSSSQKGRTLGAN